MDVLFLIVSEISRQQAFLSQDRKRGTRNEFRKSEEKTPRDIIIFLLPLKILGKSIRPSLNILSTKNGEKVHVREKEKNTKTTIRSAVGN